MTEALPNGWRVAAFKEIASVDSNLVDPAGFPDMPHIAPNYIEGDSGRLLDYQTIAKDNMTSGKHHFRAGHILYSKIRPYLNKVVAVDFEGLCSSDMYPISTNQDVKWLRLAMLAPDFVQQASSTQTGTTLPRINLKNLLKIQFWLPPVAEQERIVAVLDGHLSRLDTALEHVKIVREKADQFRRSLLHAAFTGELTGHDPSTGQLPKGWASLALEEVAEVRLGRQRSPKNHSGAQMRPYLRAANVTWTGLSLGDVNEMNFTNDEMLTYLLQPGDILVNEASGSSGEVGKAAIFDGEIEGCAFQNTLIRVRAHSVRTDFLHLLLTCNALTGAYLAEARGVGIFHLGKTKLAGWPTRLPPPPSSIKSLSFSKRTCPVLTRRLLWLMQSSSGRRHFVGRCCTRRLLGS